MDDGGFYRREMDSSYTVRVVPNLDNSCLRCAQTNCICGTIEFEKYVELELAEQIKEESLQRARGDL